MPVHISIEKTDDSTHVRVEGDVDSLKNVNVAGGNLTVINGEEPKRMVKITCTECGGSETVRETRFKSDFDVAGEFALYAGESDHPIYEPMGCTHLVKGSKPFKWSY